MWGAPAEPVTAEDEDEDDFEQLMRDMDREAAQMMDVLGLGTDEIDPLSAQVPEFMPMNFYGGGNPQPITPNKAPKQDIPVPPEIHLPAIYNFDHPKQPPISQSFGLPNPFPVPTRSDKKAIANNFETQAPPPGFMDNIPPPLAVPAQPKETSWLAKAVSPGKQSSSSPQLSYAKAISVSAIENTNRDKPMPPRLPPRGTVSKPATKDLTQPRQILKPGSSSGSSISSRSTSSNNNKTIAQDQIDAQQQKKNKKKKEEKEKEQQKEKEKEKARKR